MERKTWPYMAGILDSEGSICICQTSDGNKTKFSISVGNTDIRLMKWIVDNIGGTFSKRENRRGYSDKKGVGYLYNWILPGGKKEWFLRGILPYVVLKKEQAKLALEYVTIGNHWDTAQRNLMALKCKQLNHLHPIYFADEPQQDKSDINAYAAGMIDGDGSLFAARANSQVHIKVVSRAFCTTRWFMAHFGGRFAVRFTQDRRPYYEWSLSGRRNKELMLLRLLPYLVLKKKQAQLLLELIHMLGQHGVQEARREIVEECSALNNPVRESVTTETQKGLIIDLRHSLNFVGDHESEQVGTPVS